MSSNLKVNTILPSTGTTIGIGTVGGLINVVGNIDVNSTSGISTFNGLEISGIVTAKAGAAVTYYGDGSNLTNLPAQATIANNADNRVITGGSGVNLNGEANLTWDGSTLSATGSDAQIRLYDSTASSENSALRVMAYNGVNHIQSGKAFTSDSKADLIFGSMFGGTEWLRIGSNGSVGIGTDHLSGNASVYHKLMVEGDTTSPIAVAKIVRKNSSASNSTYTFEVDSSSHTSNVTAGGAMSVDVSSGRAFTIDGNGKIGIATITPSAAWLDIATNSGSYDHLRMRRLSSDSNIASNWSLKPYGGNLYFRTGGSTDKIYFDDSGDLNIMDGNLIVASGHGIDFSAAGNNSGMTSELLDDYEEGSFIPYIRTNGNSTEPSYSHRVGLYTKVGRLVTYVVRITTSGELSTGSGGTEMWGLPFNAMNWNVGDWPGGAEIAYYSNLRGNYGTNPRLLGPYNNASYVRFHTHNAQTDTGNNLYNHIFTNNTVMIISGQYFAA